MLKHLAKKTQVIIFAVLLVFGVSGFWGWNFYSTHYQVKAFSFDFIGDIRDEAFYAAYKAYMAWVDDGVSGGDNKLRADLKKQLKPFYNNDLSDVRFSYTSRFNDLGMTDCEHIYFGNKDIVNILKTDKKMSKNQLSWLAHELQHTEQCNHAGGRKKYAVRWFKEVKSVILKSIQNGNFKDIVKDIFNAQKLAGYDDAMSMEKEADAQAAIVVKSLKY